MASEPVRAERPGDTATRVEVVRLVARARAAAQEAGDVHPTAALDAEVSRARGDQAWVAVVGEKNRGKSSVINAVLDTTDVLPVDADVATSCHVVVGHGPLPRVHVWEDDDPEGRDVPVAELADHVAADQARGPRPRTVRGVRVEVPAPLLAEGLELVDTPGVGGLTAGHAELTLAALERADALLFVVDAQSEITASELAFLERASARISRVAFVLTKVDVHPSWEEVLARDLALVARHAPRFEDAPWFPVATTARALAARAQARGRPEKAADRLAHSGLPELAEHLTLLARTADDLRSANVVHQVSLLAVRLVSWHARRLAALTVPTEFVERVKQDKAALSALQDHDAGWRRTLADQLVRVERKARTSLERRIEDVRHTANERISAGGKGVLEAVTADLGPRVDAVWLEIETLLERGLADAARVTAAELGTDLPDLGGPVMTVPERLRTLPAPTRSRATTSLAEQGVMAMGLGMTVGGALFAMVPVLPLGLLAGAGMVALFARRRQQKEQIIRGRDDARRHVADVCARLGTEARPVIAETVANARTLLTKLVADTVSAEKARLAASLAEHEKDHENERGAVQRAKAAAERRRSGCAALRDAAEALGRSLPGGGGGGDDGVA